MIEAGVLMLLALGAFVVWANVSKPSGAAKAASPTPDDQPVWLEGRGEFAHNIVGESFYQDVLEALCGGKTDESADVEFDAEIVLEDGNEHDPLAVAVKADGKTVGYLARGGARLYRERLAELGHAHRRVFCRAKVVGGWERKTRGRNDVGHFGVKLDLA